MEWLWIPAVALVSLFILALCWLFFSDYTCCPCRRTRREELVLPTHVQSHDISPEPLPATASQHRALPSSAQPLALPPVRGEPVLPTHVQSCTLDISSRPRPPTAPQRRSLPSTRPITRPHFTLSPTGSPNLHLKFADLPQSEVIKLDHGIPTLDLHHMTVKEASLATDSFIHQSLGHYQRVKIVTGRGVHSEGGVPKIKPAIRIYLTQNNYKFKEVHNGGCYEVILGY